MYNMFGVKDLNQISDSFETQKQIMKEFGLGGKNNL
jgi:hypothetical protein